MIGPKGATERPYDQILEEERLILAATELIDGLLEREQVNRKELAERLGKSKGHVSQLLSGQRNLTLRTLAEVAFHLGARVELAAVARSAGAARRNAAVRTAVVARRHDGSFPAWSGQAGHGVRSNRHLICLPGGLGAWAREGENTIAWDLVADADAANS